MYPENRLPNEMPIMARRTDNEFVSGEFVGESRVSLELEEEVDDDWEDKVPEQQAPNVARERRYPIRARKSPN